MLAKGGTYHRVVGCTQPSECRKHRRGKVHRDKDRKDGRADILRECQGTQYRRIGSSNRSRRSSFIIWSRCTERAPSYVLCRCHRCLFTRCLRCKVKDKG